MTAAMAADDLNCSSSDSDDCQLYTRAAENVAMKRKLLQCNREELTRRLKYLPDDQITGFSAVFDKMHDDSNELVTVSDKSINLSNEFTDSDEDIPLSELLRKSSHAKRSKSSRPKRKAAKSLKTKTQKRTRRNLSRTIDCTSKNVDSVPTIILDDDTGYDLTAMAPIDFTSRSKENMTKLSDAEACDKNNKIDEEEEDLDTPCKLVIDWKKDLTTVGNIVSQRFQLRRYQKFETIYEELGRKEGLPVNRIMLLRHYDTIRPRDTPASLNLTYYGHLVGVASDVDLDHSLPKISDLDPKNPDELTVKMVLENRQAIFLTILQKQRVRVLYIKCAEELKVSESQIKIKFDGEEVNKQDKVSDLELEGGEVFDVLIKKVGTQGNGVPLPPKSSGTQGNSQFAPI